MGREPRSVVDPRHRALVLGKNAQPDKRPVSIAKAIAAAANGADISRHMQSTRVVGGAQIQVLQAAGDNTVRVTVRVSRESTPFDPARDNTVLEWARTTLAAEIQALIDRQTKLLAFGVEEQVAIDQDSGEAVLCWDSAKLLEFAQEFSADGAPRKSREDGTVPLRTAQRVAYLKSALLVKGHVTSRSVRTVACEMVARESGRTWEAVSAAERRGRKHPQFSESALPDSAREPLRAA